MRRTLALLLLAAALPMGGGGTLAAQRVRLEVTISAPAPGQAPQPQIRTPGLLQDSRWREALQSSFPLRMRFRVEIWRVRTDWFDALERSFEWETLVQFEPLTDEYSKTLIFGGLPRGVSRFTSLVELERDLERVNLVNIRPQHRGEYYFTSSLQIRTLTDQEMEDLERFLQGEQTPRDQDPGSPISRTARRILLRFGGLPYQELEARSPRFQVPLP